MATTTVVAIGAMPQDEAWEYLGAKAAQLRGRDPEGGRQRGMSQFLDEKSFRPGIEPYDRSPGGTDGETPRQLS